MGYCPFLPLALYFLSEVWDQLRYSYQEAASSSCDVMCEQDPAFPSRKAIPKSEPNPSFTYSLAKCRLHFLLTDALITCLAENAFWGEEGKGRKNNPLIFYLY